MERFAAALREARAREKMSQKDLSEKTGIATSTISSYENGGKTPSLDIAVKIAMTLGISLDGLFQIEAATSAENTFGEVIRLVDQIGASKHTKGITVISERTHEKDMRIEIHLQASDDLHGKDWAQEFARKWNSLLSTVTEDKELREMYSAWLDKKIAEASRCTIISDDLPF